MNSSPVYLQEEYAKTEIAKILNLLDEELVGLVPVKSRIREIAALLSGFMSTIGLIVILTLGLTIYGVAAFGQEKSATANDNDLQTKTA